MPPRIRRRPGRSRRRLRRVLLACAGVVVGLPLLLAFCATIALRGSLARLDGKRQLAGLYASVHIARDTLGVPDITAANRQDAARALGYLHAQERFFQMDLQRRSAAGELAALLGPAALARDREVRRHRFRTRAEAVLAAMNDRERALLLAYTEGVNAGLRDLRARPPEYWALRQKPEPWRREDSVLTLYAMFLDLSLDSVWEEKTWGCVRDSLPAALAEFILPAGNPWEAPLEPEPVARPSLPDSTLVDARQWDYGDRTWESFLEPVSGDTTGSNCWAVAGSRSGHGGSLLANDMHLGHGLPNIWYRARMSWPAGGNRRTIVGVTLPGTPAFVVASNGEVAWGFTNSYGDWLDLIILETDTTDPARYRTPSGWRALDEVIEIIAVKGAEPDTLVITETIWGPVWTSDGKGRPLVLRWTAHDAGAVNFKLLRFETARDVDAMVALAGAVGIPAQNLICADSGGRIAWTIAGRIPRRVGYSGRLPVSWADGQCRWDGYRDPAEQPRIIDPDEGLLWTANNRVAAGEHLAVIGDGGYALGARARQIRDGLRAMDRPLEADMLALQLDDRAVFLGEWRDLLLPVLEHRADGLTFEQAEFLRIVRDQWEGRALPSSVSYRLLKDATFCCIDRVYGLLTWPCKAADQEFDAKWLPFRHAVTWTVLTERPPHLLPLGCRDWDDLVLQSVARVMAHATHDGADPAGFTWGARNVVRVEHPLAQFAPRLSRWLVAPTGPLPGDAMMPRVQGRASGASQRLVVSPGREADGIFHMPAGQSGHPLSPYFLAGHQDWAEGRPTPLLPGPARHRLELRPRQ